MMKSLSRNKILDDAKELINKDRNDAYGEASINFENTANLWSGFLRRPIQPYEVGVMMALVKVARLYHDELNEDSWKDAIGYLALAGELALNDKE